VGDAVLGATRVCGAGAGARVGIGVERREQLDDVEVAAGLARHVCSFDAGRLLARHAADLNSVSAFRGRAASDVPAGLRKM
jgi:hypothetical protein